jgi:single-stranded DNA-binding protein
MIDSLLVGKLYGAPVTRTSKGGNPYVTFKVRVTTREGESLFVNGIAFAEEARHALAALSDGDGVALAGELTPKVYVPKDGGAPRPSLDLIAHQALTAYHVARKRRSMQASLPFNDVLPTGTGT